MRFCFRSRRAWGRSITTRGGVLSSRTIEGVTGLVVTISTAGPSGACTIRMLLTTATAFGSSGGLEVCEFDQSALRQRTPARRQPRRADRQVGWRYFTGSLEYCTHD